MTAPLPGCHQLVTSDRTSGGQFPSGSGPMTTAPHRPSIRCPWPRLGHMVDVAARSRARLQLEEVRFFVFGRALPAVLFAVLGYLVLLDLIARVRALPAVPSAGDVLAGPPPRGSPRRGSGPRSRCRRTSRCR